ncbi:MAG: GMC family oxidoreductase [Pedobacter sp.]|nr:MAG: GMC family oxidoreductase [Pedobacter sp.]
MNKFHYDAIVVGSGISGGWAAKELAEKGLKVLLLERGKNIEHIKDYVNANKAPWELPHRDVPDKNAIAKKPLLNQSGTLNESNPDFWVNEIDSPYTSIKPYTWKRGYQVGGRSLTWGRQTYRWSDFDFEANLIEGVAIDWPVRYKEIAPWYDYVEQFAGISGSMENLPQLPDGKFLPPMEMNFLEKDVASRIKKIYEDHRRMIIGRTANLTTPLNGRTNCQYRNRCALGCPFGGYFSSQSATLPAAVATGNLTIRPFSIVTQVLYDKDRKRAKGVEVLDAETNLTYKFTASVIFLNASTFNSAWILMNSATDIWPDGLGSSSGELGHNIMDHHVGGGATGIAKGFEDKYYYGRRANGIYIPRYRNLFGDKRNYLRGFGYQGGASREAWSREIPEIQIGGDFKDALAEPGDWSMSIVSFGEVLPYHENKISLNKNIKDKWGLSTLNIDAELKENERLMEIDMENDAVEMLRKVGLEDVKGFVKRKTIGATHEMGSARMGSDPKTSVLNKHNQIWDAPNVFVTDGSFMTSSSCVNPSLTYMAFTARAAEYAVEELKRSDL